jgi:hypothetical protein
MMILSLLLSLFIILSLIEPFNKRVKKWMHVLRFYLSRLKINRRNLEKLPRTARKFWPVLRKKEVLNFSN